MSITEVFDHLRIPLDDIKAATNNFGDSNCIGRGGFGKVYQGELELDHSGQHVTVAVKRLDSRFGQGSTEFWQEINVLSHYKHENIVSLLGFCNEVNENILVYEYLPNKSLDAHLSSPYLSWIDRLNICIGAARGLKHLQKAHGKIVLHRDIKSSNILLDANWDAKISDFGLSKTIVVSKESPFNISSPAGTHGYCDPHDLEFLTEKYDVYSFGVVLFEVLSGRLCTEKFKPLLSELARTYYEKNKIHEIVLCDLKDQISPISLAKFSAIAYQCLQRDRNKRPAISEITRELKAALVCQLGHDFCKERRLDLHTLFLLIKNTWIYNSRFVSIPKKTV